ncbi:hypothetical protein PVT71_12345 [Salipiger sp. H15]|uniref:Uncharacterized protein n=1 Tax=Alloyangia sp. H15 TaxID=3029062 RepID=A0AAU8AEU2_9RHOB
MTDNIADFEARRRAAIEQPEADDGIERTLIQIQMPEAQEIRVAVDLRHLEAVQALVLGMIGGTLAAGLMILLMT